MLDCRQRGKTKNNEIQRWKIELPGYGLDVIYRPGHDNVAADGPFKSLFCECTVTAFERTPQLLVPSECCPHDSLYEKQKPSVFSR